MERAWVDLQDIMAEHMSARIPLAWEKRRSIARVGGEEATIDGAQAQAWRRHEDDKAGRLARPRQTR